MMARWHDGFPFSTFNPTLFSTTVLRFTIEGGINKVLLSLIRSQAQINLANEVTM